MNNVLILIGTCLFGSGINVRTEGALLESLVDVLLLFLYDFLNFILHPQIVSLKESRMARHKVSLIMFDDGLEGAFNVNFMFGQLMLFHKFLLGFSSFIIQILPHGFQMILGGLMNAFGGRPVPKPRWSSEFLLSVFLGGQYYLVIGLKVLLLIKIHCAYIFIMEKIINLANSLF